MEEQGGDGFALIGGGGGGGAGGYGAIVTGGGMNINNGQIIGGLGGNGGNGAIPGASGGDGGIGVQFDIPGAFLINTGIISGGNGGVGDSSGIGGVGIIGGGLTLTNSGTISGGLGAAGAGARTNAITFSGGGPNALELQAGSLITGNVVAFSSAADTLRLGGTANATFDMSAIGPSAQYRNFGNYVKTGSSTWTLIDSSSITTNWQVNAGTLQIGNGGTSGSIQGNIINNAVVAFDRSDTVTYGGVISGSGGLIQLGTGTLVLTNANTYTGETTIANSTLALVGSGSLSFTVNVNLTVPGATFDISGSSSPQTIQDLSGVAGSFVNLGSQTLIEGTANSTLFAGEIIGSGGSFVKQGTGTLTLTGDNTYTGLTTITAGTLQLGNGGTSGSVQTDIVNNATLVFDRSDSLAYGGVISGTGNLIQAGAGTLMLNGNSSGFMGTTNVTNGILAINNALGGDLIVDPSGTLTGTGVSGSIGSTATINGHIQPGGFSSIGTLTFNGNYNQSASSVYDVNILGNAHDFINVLGSATLSNSAYVNVINDDGMYAVNTSLPILHAANGVIGEYNPTVLQVAGRPFLNLSLSYGPNDVYLNIMRNAIAFATFAITPNQVSVANALDSIGVLNPNNPLYIAMTNLSDAQTAQLAFNSLSGQIHAAAMSAYVEESRYVRDAVLNRLDRVCSEGELLVSSSKKHCRESGLWLEGYGAWGKLSTPTANTASLERSNGGVFIGADTTIMNQWQTGIVSGFGETDLRMPALSSQGDSNNAYLGIYTGTRWSRLAFHVGGSYEWHRLHIKRIVAFPGVFDSLHSRNQLPTRQVFGELGYDFYANRYHRVEPIAQLAYIDVRSNSFHEYGGISALNGFSVSDKMVYSTFGVRFNGLLWQTNQFVWQTRGLIGWQHAYDAINPTSLFAFSGSNPFAITGVPIARDAALIDTGIDMSTHNDRLHFIVGYLAQIGGKTQDNGVQGTVNWRFS
ncbi:MAG: autotransporter domain-containing protein [Legionella sp.]|uniref:autotransporter outer membrane beta-barrel domain-containing protein n=1 Tax=Legionella sp. TaxID=459 RepID=UPI0039E3181D